MSATILSRRERASTRALDVSVLLARWRSRELALAHTFRECGGAGSTEIEDILDATITALLQRGHYASEEHLFRALRKGVKMRALRLHRDRTERERILTHTAPIMHAREHERAWRDDPERALIAREDDLIISEFLADLTREEREVFVLFAEGRSWRAIATALDLPEQHARALTRSCEHKRQRFLTLYLTGRLCGYRSRTISNLLTGALANSQRALEQALAHLEHCRRCQTEHNTTTKKLRDAFDQRAAAALLPAPLLVRTHASILDRVQAVLQRPPRTLARFAHTHTVGARERLTEFVARTGATAKLTSGAIGLTLLAAGGAIGITHTTEPSHQTHDRRPHAQSQLLSARSQEPRAAATQDVVLKDPPSGAPFAPMPGTRRYSPVPFGPGHTAPYPFRQPVRRAVGERHEPPEFAYLGIPSPHNASASVAATSRTRPLIAASLRGPSSATNLSRGGGGGGGGGGGPFTP